MTINIKLAAVAGIVWGLVALGLTALVNLVPLLKQVFPSQTISLGTFAVMFAGVHFAARSNGKILEDIFGGIIAGVIAGLFMFLIRVVIGARFSMTSGLGDLPSALVIGVLAGLFGALGMIVVKKVKI